MRTLTLTLLTLVTASFGCAAGPTLTTAQIKEIAKAEGVTSVWRSELNERQGGEVDLFLFLHSSPEQIAKNACTTHETILGIKFEGGAPKVIDKNEQDKIALDSCAALSPEDFADISGNTPSTSLSVIAELIDKGIPSLGSEAKPASAKGGKLKQCIRKSPRRDLSSLIVESEKKVSAIFYTEKKKSCPKEVTASITQEVDGTVRVAIEPTIGSYTTEN
ncbi:hypothetical protein [Lysobacter sp. Hz 25]|uniref:hypothetical protein n=1 Tax=Lysobacter sp. Hz 25 TaxID=3383698 RepID=UPI0038D3E86B